MPVSYITIYFYTIGLTINFIYSGLVIDGSIAYPFNDGTKALLEVLPEDALLTMRMNE